MLLVLQKKISLLLLATFGFMASALAQNNVSGTVKDKDGQPLAAVSVTVKGTNKGTATNATGDFSLAGVADRATLVFSATGFAQQEVRVSGTAPISVTLLTSVGSMDEVVVIGYGTARRKDLTGAVATVGEKDFNKGTFTAADQLIQGKVAGVQMINNSGQPGGASTVKIRGNASVTGSGQPLYIIDGVPLDGRSARPGLSPSGLGDAPGGNPLNFLNPSDIASIDVLKDASATAIYGTRAAYGVVLVTTKRGQSGATKIDFGTSIGTSSILRRVKVLDASQYREALTYYGVSAANDLKADVNGLDVILRKGLIQTYNLAISGGNENSKYRFSGSVLDQEGIVRKTGIKKYTANFAGNFKLLPNKRLGLDINILPSLYQENLAPITNNAGSTGSLIGQALQWNPTEAFRKTDGSLNVKAGDIINPLAMSEAYNDVSRVTTLLASIAPSYKFTDWLEYKLLYSINYGTGVRRASTQQFINLGDVKDRGFAGIGQNELTTQTTTHTLNLNRDIATDLSMTALLGYEYIKTTNKGSNTNALGPNGGFGQYGLDYTNYIQFSNPGSRNVSSFVDPSYELQSYFGRVGFNFKDKYLLTGTVRRDGSTRFGTNNKYGTFPAVSAAWVLTKESFFQVNGINSLKIRGGWGKTGNQDFPSGASQATYSFGNNGGLSQTNYPNPNLKWQNDRQYNIGLDASILNNRVALTLDYFNKKTGDLLFPTFPDPSGPIGGAVLWQNLEGFVENKGLEASLNTTIISKKDFTFDFGINATFIKNEVSGLPAPIPTGGLHGQGVTGTFVQTIRNGFPINTFFTREFLGLDKGTGQALYTDGGSTFYAVGNPNPSTILGLTAAFTYKKLSFTANMNGALGQKIYNNTLNNVINVGSIKGGRNIAVSVYESEVKEAFSNPVTASSRFIEDGDYLKLANATLSYNVGPVGKVFRATNVYVTGQNLFVLTNFSGFDPEVNVDKSNRGVPSVGIEYTPYPSARIVTLGANFSF
jgi:TonB-dependent starch-binding outer membrane protein SusC